MPLRNLKILTKGVRFVEHSEGCIITIRKGV